MKPGSQRAVWLFLILGSIFGLFSVSSVYLATAATAQICCPAQRTPRVKNRVKNRASRAVREARQVDSRRFLGRRPSRAARAASI